MEPINEPKAEYLILLLVYSHDGSDFIVCWLSFVLAILKANYLTQNIKYQSIKIINCNRAKTMAIYYVYS
jgi:hypothetical protein